MVATSELRFHSSSSGFSSPLSESTFLSCDIAKAMAALRTMLKPMRAMAVRSSVMALPLKFSAAEFAICSTRAASAGSLPMTRTILSGVTLSSARTLRTRMAMSGKLGSSTLPLDSSAASACTKAKASGSLPGAGVGLAWLLRAHFTSSHMSRLSGRRPPKLRPVSPLAEEGLWRRPWPLAIADDPRRDLLDRQDGLRRADRHRLARHAPDDARMLVLGHGGGSGVAHLL